MPRTRGHVGPQGLDVEALLVKDGPAGVADGRDLGGVVGCRFVLWIRVFVIV
jgi:hypothetical protein